MLWPDGRYDAFSSHLHGQSRSRTHKSHYWRTHTYSLNCSSDILNLIRADRQTGTSKHLRLGTAMELKGSNVDLFHFREYEICNYTSGWFQSHRKVVKLSTANITEPKQRRKRLERMDRKERKNERKSREELGKNVRKGNYRKKSKEKERKMSCSYLTASVI